MEPHLHPSDIQQESARHGAELHYALHNDEERKRALYESGIVDEW